MVGLSRTRAWLSTLCCAVALLTPACMTRQVAQEAKARPALLDLYQLPSPAGLLRIFWHESPYSADTRLTVATPLDGCITLSAYVNPETAKFNLLSAEGTSVAPKTISDANAEMAQWQALPEERCAVLITAGYVIDAAFMGLSFSTRDGVFHRADLRLGAAKEEDALPGGWWMMAVFEPFMLPVYPIIGMAGRAGSSVPDEWLTRTVTISFDFPDGRRLETTLGFDEARQLLESARYWDTEAHLKTPWTTVRYWTRAGLAKLDLDFREQAALPSLTNTELVSVDGTGGRWVFDTRDGRPPATGLFMWLRDARYVRFSIAPPEAR